MRRHKVLLVLVSTVLALVATGTPGATAQRQATWGETANLSRPALATYNPVVAVARNGEAVAAWIRGDGARSRILMARRLGDGSWSSPQRMPGSRRVTELAMAFDGSGELVVAWTAGRRVRAVRRTVSGSWETPATLHRTRSGPRGVRPAYLDLAVNGRGRAAVTWETLDDDLDSTYARSRVQAVVGFSPGRWSRVRTLSARRDNAIRAQVVVSRAGRVSVVWDEANGRRARVMTASREVGERWEPSRPLTRRTRVYGSPALAVNPAGEVAVAFRTGGAAGPGIEVRRWTSDGGWGAAARVPRVRREVYWLDVGLDASGTATVGWTNPAQAVWAADQRVDGSWTRARVAPRGSVFFGLRVLVNRAGDAVVGWDGQGGREHDVEAAYRPRGGSWGPVAALSDVRGDAGGLSLALAETGDVTAAWLFARRFGADERVQARYLTAR